MRRHTDPLTLDLFEVPAPVQPTPGALAVGPALRGLLSDLLKRSPLSRHEVAARMSELTGDAITKHQLDSWTAESREGWRFPLEYLPALEEAVQTHEVTAGNPTEDDFRHALRDVVAHCIYGVDKNPMAVELARTALWLEAYTPDRPLTFLDAHP